MSPSILSKWRSSVIEMALSPRLHSGQIKFPQSLYYSNVKQQNNKKINSYTFLYVHSCFSNYARSSFNSHINKSSSLVGLHQMQLLLCAMKQVQIYMNIQLIHSLCLVCLRFVGNCVNKTCCWTKTNIESIRSWISCREYRCVFSCIHSESASGYVNTSVSKSCVASVGTAAVVTAPCGLPLESSLEYSKAWPAVEFRLALVTKSLKRFVNTQMFRLKPFNRICALVYTLFNILFSQIEVFWLIEVWIEYLC